MKAYKIISNDIESYYLTLFMLRGPFVGSTFNYAWKNLEKLGSSPKVRAQVMKRLISQNFLPGNIFSLKDSSRKSAIIKLLVDNMPEYIDSYARTCIAYYKGNKSFPMGNPTMECQDLVSLVKKKRILPLNLKNQLSKLSL